MSTTDAYLKNACEDPCPPPICPQPYSQSSPYCRQTPQTKYQIDQIINKQVRMDSSLYISKRVRASVPIKNGVWNNMSDQQVPSIQKKYMNYSAYPAYPGGMTPGGSGVDVKHGSYARYLNKLKGNCNC
jgi:hypothetical protein